MMAEAKQFMAWAITDFIYLFIYLFLKVNFSVYIHSQTFLR